MEGHISKLLSSGLKAAQSSGELFLFDSKAGIISDIRRELGFLILTLSSYLVIAASATYLVLFGLSMVLTYFGLELYHGPIYATTVLLLGSGYYAYSSRRQNVKRLNAQNKNIKTIATFKQDLSKLKDLDMKTLDRSIRYSKRKIQQFYRTDSTLKWLFEYKTVLIVSIVAAFFLRRILIKPQHSNEVKLDGPEAQRKESSIEEAIKSAFIAILIFIAKELIKKSYTSKPLA